MKEMTCWAIVAVAIVSMTFARAAEDQETQTIQAVVRKEPWKGWGGGEPLPADLKQEQAAEKFERYETPIREKAKFSGKVQGLENNQAAEAGIVALKGVHWLKNDNYEWSKVAADGSFEVVDQKFPDQRKALVVRTKGKPWTFLRSEFEPNESARDIVLKLPPSKKVLVTVEDANGERVKSFKIELFNAFEMYDDDGKKLGAQRYDSFQSTNAELAMDLPLMPMAFLISGPSIAPYYQVVDARKANHFHFVMLAPATIKGVVKRNGQPVADQTLMIVNEAAPLSATRKKTDKLGRFEATNRLPGTEDIYINRKKTSVEMKEGSMTEVEIEAPIPVATAPAN